MQSQPRRRRGTRGGVLANPEFRALWIAEAQSVVGDQLTKVAIAMLVYSRTQSALWAAGAYALTFLPALVGGLGLAQLADRHPRRTVMLVAIAVQASAIGLMAVPAMPLGAMCALLVVAGTAQAPARAAQNAMTRDVFDDDDLYYRSQDLRGITTNTLMLAGLAGAGVLVMWLGASRVLLIDAVTFVAAGMVVRIGVRHRSPAGAGKEGWSAGLRYVVRTPWLRTLLGLSWLVGLAVVPEGLAAPLASELGASGSAVGWLLAADPAGYVVGVFAFSRLLSAATRRRVAGLLATAALAVLVLFALQPALWLALVLLAVAGALGSYQVTVATTFTTLVPNDLRGSVLGVARTGLRVAQGIGVAAGGAVAQLLDSATGAIVAAGSLGVLLAVPLASAWLRHQRSLCATGRGA